MQDKRNLYLKTALVIWILFVQDPNALVACELDPNPQTQCSGLRSLRELFWAPALSEPDSFAPPSSLLVNFN